MRIIGIDPGLATVGIGLIEAEGTVLKALDWLTIETAAGTPFPSRLQELSRDLAEYLKETQPELAVLEKLYFSTNEKTALDVAHARGVLLMTIANAEIPCMEPNPLELKRCITGDGSADKKQMGTMVKMLFNLTEMPSPDDAVDALALAAFGAFQGKRAAIYA